MTTLSSLKATNLVTRVDVTVESVHPPRTLVTKQGKTVTLLKLTVKDETARLPLTLWEEPGQPYPLFKPGQVLRLHNVRTSLFREEIQLGLQSTGHVEVIDQP